ncbi:MAG: hypothetical protein K6A92_12835 [Lachnospiraceae bacterium]|nr:hypothetical protein [Lachnospiraceae bacterium]
MANAILNTVFNQYMTTYAPKSTTQYDTHKKSELRGVYNSIVKLNKEAPLYLLDTSKDTQSFAVEIKENAARMTHTLAELRGDDGEDALFHHKSASSSDEDIVTAEFVGSLPEGESAENIGMDIEVEQLASAQKNIGSFLKDEPISLPGDTYSFDVGINGLNYEFQFNIHQGESNREVQERLARLLDTAGVGLHAYVESNEEWGSALRIESLATGAKADGSPLFTISDDQTSMTTGAVEYFGLNQIVSPSTNASFKVNGHDHTASQNHFTIDKTFEVDLQKVAPGETVHIAVKNDAESVLDNMVTLTGTYNTFIQSAYEYTESHPSNTKLINELKQLSANFEEPLGALGIHRDSAGLLSINRETLINSVQDGSFKEGFSVLQDFADALKAQSDKVALNPMDYTDKKVVAYKNPGHNFVNPYVTSAYAGMMFNFYC